MAPSLGIKWLDFINSYNGTMCCFLCCFFNVPNEKFFLKINFFDFSRKKKTRKILELDYPMCKYVVSDPTDGPYIGGALLI